MSKLITKLSASVVALMLALPVQAQEDLTADSVIASINGTDITLGHMIMVRASLPEQYQNLPDNVLWDGILDQLIQQTALTKQAEGESRRIELALENERRSLLAAQVIEGIVEEQVTEEALQDAYERAYLQGEATEEYNASHILVTTQEEATAIADELNGGADFPQMAREKSTGPSGPNGGELGWFGPGMMVPEFQSMVETLEVGEISEPVQTQFGWHVIILNDKRVQEAPAFESVRAQLETELGQEIVGAAIDAAIQGADVTRMDTTDVDLSVLNNLDLLED